MFRRLLVPLDGSPESEDILSEASRIAAETAEFFLLHVTPTRDDETASERSKADPHA